MPKYRITADKCELPQGSNVHIVPVPVNTGDLAMFAINDSQNLFIGRYYSNIAGHNWMVQPGTLIMETKTSRFRILGRAVPAELASRTITS